MRRSGWFQGLAAAAVVTSAQAGWVSLGPAATSTPGRSPQVEVRQAEAPHTWRVVVTVPGIQLGQDGPWATARIPGQPWRAERGAPEVPRLAFTLRLPDRGRPEVRLVRAEDRELRLDQPLAPSRGPLTRDLAPSAIPRQLSQVHAVAGWRPARFEVEVGKPWILQDLRAVPVRMNAGMYDAARSSLRVVQRAVFEVTLHPDDEGANPRRAPRPVANADLATLYRRVAQAPRRQAPQDGGRGHEAPGSALVLTPAEWVPTLAPLLAWRDQVGVPTEVVTLEEVGSDPEAIQARIRQAYEAAPLTHVLFVGDAERIPPKTGGYEGADCDACYAFLEGDDFMPDVMISRFSADDADEVAVQVARTVRYERDPAGGSEGAQYHRSVGVASNEGVPTDYELMEQLRDSLTERGWDYVDRIYDPDREQGGGSWIGRPETHPGMVHRALSQRRAMINYLGHGSNTAWMSSRFSVKDVRQLTNTAGDWPVIWSVACVNGNFVPPADCFAEAWLKAGTPEAPAGAVGMVASTTNMAWDPPVDWQRAIVRDSMAAGRLHQGGALHLAGLAEALQNWGSGPHGRGTQIVEQCIYFGDSSVLVRTGKPRSAEVEARRDEGYAEVTVRAGGAPVAGARVALRGSQGGRWVALADEDGRATFDGLPAGGTLEVNVTGPNLVPALGRELASGTR